MHIIYIMWLKQSYTTHLGMVYGTYENGDDWGMVYGIALTTLWKIQGSVVGFPVLHLANWGSCLKPAVTGHPGHRIVAFIF